MWRRHEKSARLMIQWPKNSPGIGQLSMTKLSYAQAAKMIDHSLLQPTLTDADLEAGCRLARDYNVASVCIKPYAVRQGADWLRGSTVAGGSAIGFPHGGRVTAINVTAPERAPAHRALELHIAVTLRTVLCTH